jgi:hypothetical protein
MLTYVLRTYTSTANELFTICLKFQTATWVEREAYDMFGIFFMGNQDMRKILNDHGFDGNALPEDYPLAGYCDMAWNDERKRIELPDLGMTEQSRAFKLKDEWKKEPEPVWRGFQNKSSKQPFGFYHRLIFGYFPHK